MGRFEIHAPAPVAAAAVVLVGLSIWGCAAPSIDATPAASATTTAAVQTAEVMQALRRRCAGHMYAERSLRGGRGPLNRFEFDRCMAQGASR